MAKTQLSPQVLFDLRSSLQVATLAALMSSRRWEPGQLAFQGGSCLSLAHGSSRFSEDLDFMIRSGMSIAGLEKVIESKLILPSTLPKGLKPTVSIGKDNKNPHSFNVTLSGADFIGSAKVKVEMWSTPADVMDRLSLVVRPVTALSGAQTFVSCIVQDEVLADKVYALGARDRLKARDIYDLWWLDQNGVSVGQGTPEELAEWCEKLLMRLEIYPNGSQLETAQNWLRGAQVQLAELAKPVTVGAVMADLQRWLPSSHPLTSQHVQEMIGVATESLKHGMGIFQAYTQRLSDTMSLSHQDGEAVDVAGPVDGPAP